MAADGRTYDNPAKCAKSLRRFLDRKKRPPSVMAKRWLRARCEHHCAVRAFCSAPTIRLEP